MSAPLTLDEALKEKPKHVYAPDGSGGITCYELDWDECKIFAYDNQRDEFSDDITDFFDLEPDVYRDIQSCAATFIST